MDSGLLHWPNLPKWEVPLTRQSACTPGRQPLRVSPSHPVTADCTACRVGTPPARPPQRCQRSVHWHGWASLRSIQDGSRPQLLPHHIHRHHLLAGPVEAALPIVLAQSSRYPCSCTPFKLPDGFCRRCTHTGLHTRQLSTCIIQPLCRDCHLFLAL